MIGFLKKFGKKEQQKQVVCSAVVVAAGSASRMGGIDKILVNLNEKPVLAYTLEALQQCDLIAEIVIVTREDLIVDIGKLCKEFEVEKATKIMVGGKERVQSVKIGVSEVREDATMIAIHDGARPFVSQDVLHAVLTTAQRTNAAAPAIPVTDTIKRAEKNLVVETPSREELFAVQTPQVFEASLIKGALEKAVEDNASLTDDCSAVERLGMKVTLTKGEAENIKITTPLDLLLAEGIINRRREVLP